MTKPEPKTPWIGLIVVCSAFSFGIGCCVGNAVTATPKPSPAYAERCTAYCRGVASGGSMTWDDYGFICMCSDLKPKPWVGGYGRSAIKDVLQPPPKNNFILDPPKPLATEHQEQNKEHQNVEGESP